MGGFRTTLKDAIPLLSSSIVMLLMGMTDTFFCSRIGDKALIPQSLASFIYGTEFMFLAASILPIANIRVSSSKEKQEFFLAGLLLCLFFSILIILFNWEVSNFIADLFLPYDLRDVFVIYFRIISLAIIPGQIFIYYRTVMTSVSNNVVITKEIMLAFFINLMVDMFAWLIIPNQIYIVAAIALTTNLVFLFLSYRLSLKVSYDYSLYFSNLFKVKFAKIFDVFMIVYPSSLTTLCEFSFFTCIGIIVTKNVIGETGLYRVILQINEVLILVIYSISTIISIEMTNAGEFKSNKVKYLAFISLLISFLLYILYPWVIWLFNQSLSSIAYTRELASLLFLSESIMLITFVHLKACAKYNIIFALVFVSNWLIIMPMVLLISSNKTIDYYLFSLCVNNILIGLSCIFINKKFLKDFYINRSVKINFTGN